MKKIILVAYDLNPYLGSECGTAYLWLKLISKHYFVEVFTDAKHKQDILSKKYENVNFNFIDLDNFLYRLFSKLRLFKFNYTNFIKKIRPVINDKLKNNNYGLIHCITPAGMHSYNDLYEFGLPIILGPVGGSLETPSGFNKIFIRKKLRDFVRKLYYSSLRKNITWKNYFIHANRIIIGTNNLKDSLPNECHNKTTVIFDTLVDPKTFLRTNKKRGNEIKIAFCGRFDAIKGCTILFEAFRNLIRDNKIKDNVTLVYAGEGQLFTYIKKNIIKNKLTERIILLGKIKKNNIIELLNESDIFCLPTLRDHGGGSILEAMACELPIITSNYGGPAYSVTNACGIKIEPNNYDDYVKNLEKALLYLIENKSERIRMGKNGRKRVIAEFSPQAIEKKIVKIYYEVLKGK